MPPARTRIPELLRPYTSYATDESRPGSLTLLTGTLSASTAWLVLRFLGAAFEGHHSTGQGTIHDEEKAESAVVLASWSREFGFWKETARKSCGLDLPRLAAQNRFAFVDGLSETCLPPDVNADDGSGLSPLQNAARRPVQPHTPGRAGGIIPSRGPALPRPEIPAASKVNGTGEQAKGRTTQVDHGLYTLSDPSLDTLLAVASAAISHVGGDGIADPSDSIPSKSEATDQLPLKRRNVILVLDAPDVLGACLGEEEAPVSQHVPRGSTEMGQATPQALAAAILQLREQVHSTVLTVFADSALLNHPAHSHPSHSDFHSAATPLETNQSALVLGLAHTADVLLQCRPLDTGTAGDVSGVLRAGLGCGALDDLDTDSEGSLKEGEWLYHVQTDGGAKVFERGSEAQGGE